VKLFYINNIILKFKILWGFTGNTIDIKVKSCDLIMCVCVHVHTHGNTCCVELLTRAALTR